MRFRKRLTFFILALGLVFALPALAQEKPMTQDQVQALVRDGFGDKSGAELIEQRGIDFAPADDFLQTLKPAGATEAFLKALREAKPPKSEAHEALRLRPNDPEAHYDPGVALAHMGDWDGAIARYREALRLNPESAEAHYDLGDRHLRATPEQLSSMASQ